MTGVNDDPVPPSGFNGDTSIVAATGTPETVTVPAFTDADANDTLTYTYAVTLNGAAVTPAPTWLTVDSTDLVFTVGTPPANTLATGVDSAAYVVTVTATDSQSATATVQFTVTVTRTANAIPTVTAVTGTATEGLNGAAGASAIPNLLDNATDADTGDTLTVSRYTAGSDINMGAQTAGNNLAGTHGMLNITAAGVVTYTPNDSLGAGDVTDTFLFEVADNRGGRSAPATLTITVTGVNDSPVPPSGFNGDRSIVASATAGTPETVTVPAFTDPESDTLTISHAVTLNGAAVTPAPTWLTVDSTGLVFTVSTPPATTTTGDYEVTVTATDGTSTPATFQFTITVTGSAATNTKPVAPAIPNQTATEGMAFRFVVPAFTDADGDTLAYRVTGRPFWLNFDATTRTLSGTPRGRGCSHHHPHRYRHGRWHPQPDIRPGNLHPDGGAGQQCACGTPHSQPDGNSGRNVQLRGARVHGCGWRHPGLHGCRPSFLAEL